MFKRSFKFLGAEANARAITSITVIASLVGAILMFVVSQILPIFSPTFQSNSFGQGYRTGKRETLLEIRNQRLKAQIESRKSVREIEKEIRNMTPEQRRKELQQWVRP